MRENITLVTRKPVQTPWKWIYDSRDSFFVDYGCGRAKIGVLDRDISQELDNVIEGESITKENNNLKCWWFSRVINDTIWR